MLRKSFSTLREISEGKTTVELRTPTELLDFCWLFRKQHIINEDSLLYINGPGTCLDAQAGNTAPDKALIPGRHLSRR